MALQNYKSWNFVRDLKLSCNWIRPGGNPDKQDP